MRTGLPIRRVLLRSGSWYSRPRSSRADCAASPITQTSRAAAGARCHHAAACVTGSAAKARSRTAPRCCRCSIRSSTCGVCATDTRIIELDEVDWDLLLELLRAERLHQRLSVSALTVSSTAASATTSLRRVNKLVSRGYVIRIPDASDARRDFVSLTSKVERSAGRLPDPRQLPPARAGRLAQARSDSD